MGKKYELTKETKSRPDCEKVVYRIRALRDIDRYGVKAGDLGGFVESESNLSQEGDCWIKHEAMVYDNASIRDNALIGRYAKIYDDSIIYNNAIVYDFADVSGRAKIYGNSMVIDHANVFGWARVHGNARITDYSCVYGWANIEGDVYIRFTEHIYYDADISDESDHIFIGLNNNKKPITFFTCKDNSICLAGGFYGTLDQFREDIIRCYDEKTIEEYLLLANFIQIHFKKDN